MPADRTLAAEVAQALVDMYASAQSEIVDNITRRLKAGIDQPGWDHAKLAALAELKHSVNAILGRLQADPNGVVEQTVVLAMRRGGQAAIDEIAKAGHMSAQAVAELKRIGINTDAVTTLAFSLRSTLLGTHLRILRWSIDSYRDVVAKAAVLGPGLIGIRTRLQVAQKAWQDLLDRGVTGFTDKAGRNWELASYVEMATRTTIAHAVVQAHSDQLDQLGVPLRIVSNAPQECRLCRPWEGKVLVAKFGAERRQIFVRARSALTGEPVVVRVAGTVDEAIAAGLLHPNCRHTISAYLPGVTVPPTNTDDPQGDKARQQQRALERRIRAAKLQQRGALDPAARTAAAGKVRAAQAALRQHLADNPGLMRQSNREQIGRAR